MSNSNAPRVIIHETFHDKGFTDENSLSRALLTKPDTINPVLTHLAGREDAKFPLSFLTEGQTGGTRPLEIQSIEYDWKTFRRLKKSDHIKSTQYSSSDKPGLGQRSFYVVFSSRWLKKQHTIVSRTGVQARIQENPVAVADGYKYELQLITGSDGLYVIVNDNLLAGMEWAMLGGASVSNSDSRGNESNVTMPGSIKNQISILRKSYHQAGNISGRTVECKFNTKGNGTTSLWMEFERWQHTMEWKQACEEHYWYSKYNRNAEGAIKLIDRDSGQPIPIGAGVFDQIPNFDTYAQLTAQKIKRTVADVFYGGTDTGVMDIVLYTGSGGAEEFDEAMKDEASGFSLVSNANVGNKFVTGGEGARNLSYGAYFTQYKHVDGHSVTVKKLPLLDFGARAEVSPKHPKTNKPLESYKMIFLDQSTYDGVRNVQMITQKGRSMITGVEQGMSQISGGPSGSVSTSTDVSMSYTGNALSLATEQDRSSIHFLSAKGICINRNTHCFVLDIDQSIGM